MRLFVVGNFDKPLVKPALDAWLPLIKSKVELVGVTDEWEGDFGALQADVVLVLGGDGTLLGTARQLRGRAIPVMGINFGRLGFLASFTPENFPKDLDDLVAGRLPVQRRMMAEASVVSADISCPMIDYTEVKKHRRFHATALNDAVITAGPPFHMVELELGVNGEDGVRYFGDGVIVATPSGSTAYNVSAGGPIMNPDVEAFCITPICPHSLSFRPVVVSDRSTVVIHASRVNEGTTLFCDGQASTKLLKGDKIVIRRSEHDILLIENPHMREWRELAEKLNWAVTPKYNETR